ncbi:hypothetical protein IJD34_02055 [bacterium]|nr:hypothetical protein [bacterium]
MIPAINSATSFKAFYKPNDVRFSESQQAVIKDIETKLGDRVKENDYCVVPKDKNRVGLYKVSNPRVNLFNNNLHFDKISHCATCDEWHPFDVQKYDAAEKTLKQMGGCLDIALKIIITIAALAITLTIFSALKSRNNVAKAQSELFQKFDTLKENLAKNSLDLTKRFNN